jgi:hypothetical protein
MKKQGVQQEKAKPPIPTMWCSEKYISRLKEGKKFFSAFMHHRLVVDLNKFTGHGIHAGKI